MGLGVLVVFNKKKYFSLRLSYKISEERAPDADGAKMLSQI